MRKLTVTIDDYNKAVRVIDAAIKENREISIITTCAVSQAARRTWKTRVSSCQSSVSSYRRAPGEILDKKLRFQPIESDKDKLFRFVRAFDNRQYGEAEIAKDMLPLTITLERLRGKEL